MPPTRSAWTALTDEQLLAQCEVDTYRASGPGGQKRNKTSSAIRLRHPPSGLIVIAEDSRSQHENKARALKRLRQALYLQMREPLTPESAALSGVRDGDGRLDVRVKHPGFWPAVGVALDALAMVEARVSDAAALLATTTGNLVDLLEQHPKVWQQANVLRQQFGQKPLKA